MKTIFKVFLSFYLFFAVQTHASLTPDEVIQMGRTAFFSLPTLNELADGVFPVSESSIQKAETLIRENGNAETTLQKADSLYKTFFSDQNPGSRLGIALRREAGQEVEAPHYYNALEKSFFSLGISLLKTVCHHEINPHRYWLDDSFSSAVREVINIYKGKNGEARISGPGFDSAEEAALHDPDLERKEYVYHNEIPLLQIVYRTTLRQLQPNNYSLHCSDIFSTAGQIAILQHWNPSHVRSLFFENMKPYFRELYKKPAVQSALRTTKENIMDQIKASIRVFPVTDAQNTEKVESMVRLIGQSAKALAEGSFYDFGFGLNRKDLRGYQQAIKDCLEAKLQIVQLVSNLVAHLFPHLSENEKKQKIKEYLALSRDYSWLKCAFCENPPTAPNLDHWYWQEMIFSSETFQELTKNPHRVRCEGPAGCS